MKTQKIIYWVVTGFLSLMFLISASMYFVKNADMQVTFEGLGFPTWIIYPLAICKIGAIAVILSNKGGNLKQWAYAGLFFNAAMAFGAHIAAADDEHFGAVLAVILIFVSYFLGKKVRP